jgi:hypothetical protein
MGKSKNTLQLIEWNDSHSPNTSGWLSVDEVDTRPLKLKSVGYVIAECKRSVTLAAHVSASKNCDQVCGVMSIPKSCIIKRKKLGAA